VVSRVALAASEIRAPSGTKRAERIADVVFRAADAQPKPARQPDELTGYDPEVVLATQLVGELAAVVDAFDASRRDDAYLRGDQLEAVVGLAPADAPDPGASLVAEGNASLNSGRVAGRELGIVLGVVGFGHLGEPTLLS